MGLLRTTATYDRRRILDAAARAAARRCRRRAIALYRWVLVVEPSNPEIHAKLAPLLAQTGQRFDAWQSFRASVRAALREGRDDHAIAILHEAARNLPREPQIPRELAHIHLKRGQGHQAIEILLEGSRRLRSRRDRPWAIDLLRRARSIDPWAFEIVFEMARQLARSDQIHESRLLLEGLAARIGGDELRRVRGAQFLLDASLTSAWRWLHSAVRPADAPAPPQNSRVLTLRSSATPRR